MKRTVDLSIIKWAEVARKIELEPGRTMTPIYAHFLISGRRKSEKRLRQIADVVGVSVAVLKEYIRQTNNGRANAGACAHPATHSHPPRSQHRREAFARPNISKTASNIK